MRREREVNWVLGGRFWKAFSPIASCVYGVWSCGSSLMTTEEVERWTEHRSLFTTLIRRLTNSAFILPLIVPENAFSLLFKPTWVGFLLLATHNIINNAEDSDVFLPGTLLILTQGKENLGPCLGIHACLPLDVAQMSIRSYLSQEEFPIHIYPWKFMPFMNIALNFPPCCLRSERLRKNSQSLFLLFEWTDLKLAQNFW